MKRYIKSYIIGENNQKNITYNQIYESVFKGSSQYLSNSSYKFFDSYDLNTLTYITILVYKFHYNGCDDKDNAIYTALELIEDMSGKWVDLTKKEFNDIKDILSDCDFVINKFIY